jgi:protein SCO1/2
MTARIRNLLLFLLSAACLAVTAGVVYVLVTAPETVEAPLIGRFELTDADGKRVTEADFAGRYMLVYFGYTYCPDVCPTELAKMTAALDLFTEADPARAAKITPIFISVDPDRDTPARLKEYAALFHPRLVALTGTDAQIRAVANTYKVYYAKVGPEGGPPSGDDYLMDHSSQIYLMDPNARYITYFPSTATAKDIADALAREVE